MQINSTIFKTWLNDINKVALAMDGLQSITQFKTGSTIANGMELSTVAVNKYKASIKGLSLSQAETALSTTALNEAQQKQILISAGLLTSTDYITASELKQVVAENILTTAKQQEVLATFEAEMAEGKLNLERLEGITFENAEAETIRQLIIAKKAENAENLKRIATNKSLNAVLKEQLLLLLKNPFTWIVVGTAAAVVSIDLFTESLAEAQEKAEKSKQTYDDLVSELSTLRQEADSAREKIEELQKLADNGAISLVEQNELDKLKDANEELEREIRLKEYAAQMAGKEASDDAVNAITKKSETYSTGSVDPNTPVSELPRNASQIYTAQEDRIDAFQRRIDSATVKQEELNALIERQKKIEQSFGNEADKYAKDSEWKKLQNQVDAKKNEIQTFEKEMSDYYDALSSEDDALRDEYGNIIEGAEETVSRLETVYKSFDLYGAGGQTAVDKVVEYFGDSNNKSIVDTLQDAYGSFADGDISKSALYSMEEYQVVIDETGISAFYLEQHLRDLAKAKKELGSQNPDEIPVQWSDIFAFENAEGELNALGQLNAELDKLQSSASGLKEAVDSYNTTGKLTVDQLQDVLSYGDGYLKYLTDEEGQLVLNEDALKKVAMARVQEMKVKALGSLYDQINAIENEEQALSFLETQLYDTADATNEYNKEAFEQLLISKANLLSTEDFAKFQSTVMNMFNSINTMFDNVDYNSLFGGASDSTKDIENTNKKYVEAYLTFMEESLNSSKIDYKTYCSEVSGFLKRMFDESKISAEDYHDYTKQMLEEQKSIYDKALNAIIRRFNKEIEKINDAIEAIEKHNEALEKQKDEYDKILSVIDSVYEKEIQVIEDQKQVLQDKIDALNDEADAYDLIRRKEEALYALEQAKNQRVKKVYNGTQFVYETDQSVIREAQDNLQDIKNEEIISMLEKEQESLDESIELLEHYRDLWAEISDAYEIEMNKQLAIALFGENYESIILSNRLSDIEDFKDNYISIQEQIDSNESMIASFEEKKEIYENLKEKWDSVSNAYQESMEDQYASMLLGQDWEKQVLDGRIGILNDFRNDYISIQQAIADAAWASANAQIDALNAVNERKKGAVPDIGDSVVTDNTATATPTLTGATTGVSVGVITKNVTYKVSCDGMSDEKSYTFDDKNEAEDFAKKLNEARYLNRRNWKVQQINQYAKGGKNLKEQLGWTQEYGAETLLSPTRNAILTPISSGDSVLTKAMTENLWKWAELNPITFTPSYNPMNFANLPMRNNTQDVSISIGDIQLYGVQNVDDLGNQIVKRLPNVMLQAINRR